MATGGEPPGRSTSVGRGLAESADKESAISLSVPIIPCHTRAQIRTPRSALSFEQTG
jgi:hypothetical protein